MWTVVVSLHGDHLNISRHTQVNSRETVVWKAMVSMTTAGRVCRTLTCGWFPLPHLRPQGLCTCWLEALGSARLEEIMGCSAHPPHLPCGEMHWDPVCRRPVCTSHTAIISLAPLPHGEYKIGYLVDFQQKFILELAVNRVMTSFLEEHNGIKKTRF